ncbi:MAG: hypothetical protein HGA85_04925, partial [Nanoarchaeota archaeon]|nr:hypothetical protein [Nanoarchaeota archaeon]
ILSPAEYIHIFETEFRLRGISTNGWERAGNKIYEIMANAAYQRGAGEDELKDLFQAIVRDHGHRGELLRIFGNKFPDIRFGIADATTNNLPQNTDASALQIAFSLLNSESRSVEALGFSQEAYLRANQVLEGTGNLLNVIRGKFAADTDRLSLVKAVAEIKDSRVVYRQATASEGLDFNDLVKAILASAQESEPIDHRWRKYSPELSPAYQSLIPRAMMAIKDKGFDAVNESVISGHRSDVKSYVGRIRLSEPRRTVSLNQVVDQVCGLIWNEISTQDYVSCIKYQRGLDEEETRAVNKKMREEYGINLSNLQLTTGSSQRQSHTLTFGFTYATNGAIYESAKRNFDALVKMANAKPSIYNTQIVIPERLGEPALKQLEQMLKKEEIDSSVLGYTANGVALTLTPTGKRAASLPGFWESSYPEEPEKTSGPDLSTYQRTMKPFKTYGWRGMDENQVEPAVLNLTASKANHFYKEYIVGRRLEIYVKKNSQGSGADYSRALIEDAIDVGRNIFNENDHPGALDFLVQLRDNTTQLLPGKDWDLELARGLREIKDRFIPYRQL